MKKQDFNKLTREELIALILSQGEYIETLEEDWKDMYDEHMKLPSLAQQEKSYLTKIKDDIIEAVHKDLGSLHKKFRKLDKSGAVLVLESEDAVAA